MIDLLRLILASNPAAFKPVKEKDAVINVLLKAIEVNTSWEPPVPKPRDTNLLLVLRTVANMFHPSSGTVPAPWTATVSASLFDFVHNLINIAIQCTIRDSIYSVEQGSPSSLGYSLVQVNIFSAPYFVICSPKYSYSCVIHRSKNGDQDQEKHLELIAAVYIVSYLFS